MLFAGSYFSSSLSRLISMMVTVVVRLRLGDLFSGQLGCVAEVQNIVFNSVVSICFSCFKTWRFICKLPHKVTDKFSPAWRKTLSGAPTAL